jgi:hypothetical protein
LGYAKVDHAPGGRKDGAKERVAATAVGNFFTPNGVLLVVECKFDGSCSKELGIRGCSVTDGEGSGIKDNVRKTEWVRLLWCGAVLAWAHQKVEGEAHHIHDSSERDGAVGNRMRQGSCLDEEGKGERFDPVRRRVLFLKGLVHAGQANVDATMGV